MYNSSILCKPNRFHFFFSKLISFFSSRFIFIFSLLLTTSFLVLIFGDTNRSFAEDSITYTQKIVHKHTGTSRGGGGCYGNVEVRTTTVEEPCKGHMVYYPEWNRTQCDICGASYDGDQSFRECWTTYPTTVKEAFYRLNCGYSDNQQIGTYSVVQDTSAWSNDVTLAMSLSSTVLSEEKAKYKINGNVIEGHSYSVPENGVYTVSLVTSSNTSAESIELIISNIDKSAPAISVDYDPTPDLPNVDVIITADDGDGGSGLDLAPYSFDGGNTWTDNPICNVTENGTLDIVVRDKAGNETTEIIEISNIKKPEPPKPENATPSGNNPGDNDTGNNSGNNTPVNGTNGNDTNVGDNNDDATKGNGEGDTEDLAPAENLDATSKKLPDTPVATPTPTVKKKPSPSTEGANKETVKVQVTSPVLKTAPQPADKKELKKEQTTVPSIQRASADLQQPAKKSKEIPELITALLWGIGVICLCGLFALIALFLNRISFICNMKENDKYVFKGLTNITGKEGIYEIKINQKLFEKCATGKLLIKLPPIFAISHEGRDMVIYLPDKQSITVSVSRRIYLSVKI